MFEVLNLSSRQFNIGVLSKIPGLVELQPKTHRVMMRFVRKNDTSFNINPIRFIKDLVSYHMPTKVLIDDKTNIPGLIETMTNDLGISVILESDKERGIFEYSPREKVERLSCLH